MTALQVVRYCDAVRRDWRALFKGTLVHALAACSRPQDVMGGYHRRDQVEA